MENGRSPPPALQPSPRVKAHKLIASKTFKSPYENNSDLLLVKPRKKTPKKSFEESIFSSKTLINQEPSLIDEILPDRALHEPPVIERTNISADEKDHHPHHHHVKINGQVVHLRKSFNAHEADSVHKLVTVRRFSDSYLINFIRTDRDDFVNAYEQTMSGSDATHLQLQLTKVMDDASQLRSQLRVELEQRHRLERRIQELSDKLADAKQGLQETRAGLNKVQTVAQQLIGKRDEREAQLEAALEKNAEYARKIAELELHNAHLSQVSSPRYDSSNAMNEKLVNEQREKLRQQEIELHFVQTQLAASRRENFALGEEKKDIEYMLETKKKRIVALEEHLKTVEADLDQLRENNPRRNSFTSSPNTTSSSAAAAVSATMYTGNNGNLNLRPDKSSEFAGVADPDIEAMTKKLAGLNELMQSKNLTSMEAALQTLMNDKAALEAQLVNLDIHTKMQSSTSFSPRRISTKRDLLEHDKKELMERIIQLETTLKQIQRPKKSSLQLDPDALPDQLMDGGAPMSSSRDTNTLSMTRPARRMSAGTISPGEPIVHSPTPAFMPKPGLSASRSSLVMRSSLLVPVQEEAEHDQDEQVNRKPNPQEAIMAALAAATAAASTPPSSSRRSSSSSSGAANAVSNISFTTANKGDATSDTSFSGKESSGNSSAVDRRSVTAVNNPKEIIPEKKRSELDTMREKMQLAVLKVKQVEDKQDNYDDDIFDVDLT